MNQREICMVFPLGLIEDRTRLTKVAKVCKELNIQIESWAWIRNANEKKECKYSEKQNILLKGGGSGLKRTRLMYPLWVLVVFFKALFAEKSKKYYCLGFESALPIYMVKPFKECTYIFDDADRFSLIFKLPSFLEKLLKKIEKKVSESSSINIIPGIERYEFRNEKQFILKNTPDKKVLNRSRNVHLDIPKDNKLTILINGRIVDARGADIMLEIVNIFSTNKNISFIAAGYAIGKNAKLLVDHSNVNFLGQVSNEHSLALFYLADLVFTLYDPIIEINKYAEPNKWGDCLVTGCIPIVNDEVITANYLRRADACISVPYHNVDSFVEVISQLIGKKSKLDYYKKNVSSLSKGMKYFDSEIEQILINYLS